MNILVGNTGFVGSNLAETMEFDKMFNSKNISEAYGTNPDLLVYAGVRGTKFLANKFPDEDRINIENAILNIKRIKPKKLVLISTVDVYDDLNGKDEDYLINPDKLHEYGKNRYNLEQWVQKNVADYHIIRLPAIYGKNLKKNFIHDLINPIPQYITQDDYSLIVKEFKDINLYYHKNGDLYTLEYYNNRLFDYFLSSKYNSLRFTDSRSCYQYWDLRELEKVIIQMINKNIKILNCVNEKISSEKLYKSIFNIEFRNEIDENPIKYNLRTKYSLQLCGLKDGYLINEDNSENSLIKFIQEERGKI